jgi:hypothetical protein
MAKRKILKTGAFLLAGALLLGVAAPFINADAYGARIESALEHALGRKVKVGSVRLSLFTGPGFTVENVEIGDDPAVGLEPLAYVDSLQARVRLSALFTGKLAFSNLKLNQPTLNLVQAESGVWNFQLLKGGSGALPTIQVRDGRINFKFGNDKSVFYLSQSDLDITPIGDARMDVRFAGQPARTDQAAQSFGMLLARGIWKRPDQGESEIDVNAEIERSAVSELARIIEGRPIGLHGIISSRAHISGPISRLAVTGQIRLEDVHRWDILPKGGAVQLNYKGQIDLNNQRLELGSADTAGVPLTVRIRASELLSLPHWAASIDMRDVPATTFIEAARHMGVAIPDRTEVEGRLNGAVSFSHPGGFQGQLQASDAVLKSPGAPVMKFRSANVLIDGNRLDVGPATVETDSGQSASLNGRYDLATQALDVKITTEAMNAGELQTSMGVRVPVLGSLEHGIWKGELRYRKSLEDAGAWSGEFDLRDARLNIAGLAEPLRISTATVTVSDRRTNFSRIRGRAGNIKFTADYRMETAKPDRMNLEIPEASLDQLESLMMPALRRQQSIFARLRLRPAPLPEWLRERRIEGTVQIDNLDVDGQTWQVDKSRLTWNAAALTLSDIAARHDETALDGSVTAMLAGPVPQYRAIGKVRDIEYKGGLLEMEGTLETTGTGLETIANAHAEGNFNGENLTLAPDTQFNTIAGSFEWASPARLKLKTLQAAQGLDSYTGQGATQGDGRLLLELSSGKGQAKVASTPFGKQ